MNNISSYVAGIPEFERYLNQQVRNIEKAAILTVNTVAKNTYTELKRKVMSNVNLKASYLDGRDGRGKKRLEISQYAKQGEIVAKLVGRDRATSLARFDARKVGRQITVKVKNRTKIIKSGLLLDFRGNRLVGLRVKKGETIRNKKLQAKKVSSSKNTDLYILYGPSVQQVVNQVAPEIIPDIEKKLGREFLRQLRRLK